MRRNHTYTLESRLHGGASDVPTSAAIFWRTTIGDRNLSSISQAGLVNNLNDGMAWGLFPLFFAAAGMSLERTAALARHLPGHLGSRAARNGRALGPDWTQVVDRRRHVDAGWRHRRHCDVGGLLRVRDGFGIAGCWNRDGLPDAPCWYRRCRLAIVARISDWCIPLLARSWLRDRRAHRWRDGGPARPGWCVLDRRGIDVHLRADRRVSHERDLVVSECWSGNGGPVRATAFSIGSRLQVLSSSVPVVSGYRLTTGTDD